jgi:hypothetical protein
MTGHHRNVDSENRPAIAAGPSMPDKPLRYRSSPPTPSDSVGNLPPPLYATYWGYLSQADTHLMAFNEAILGPLNKLVNSMVSSAAGGVLLRAEQHGVLVTACIGGIAEGSDQIR